ncbi:monoglyceride lipase-like [Amblyomma americanum]
MALARRPALRLPEECGLTDSATFKNGDGHSIACKSWKPDGEPRALVFMAHGFGEHCHGPTYDLLARELAALGCYVFAHDHGKLASH